jgi:hypothetical protein
MPDAADLDVDDAIQFLIRYLREDRKSEYGSYGYGLYLHHVARDYLKDLRVHPHELDQELHRRDAQLSRVFFAAAWELCRRGILRPGLKSFQGQATDAGGSGHGYSLTPFGETWIRQASEADYVPTQPSRFAQMLTAAGTHFGPGLVERSEQAVAAYNAHAFLACCAMCGAAAESVVLALAIAKEGGERQVLDAYVTASGRGRIEKRLLGNQPTPVQEEFHRYTTLLKYWRDNSAHGRAVRISEPEAYQSLALLLRFARWAEDRWEDLIR